MDFGRKKQIIAALLVMSLFALACMDGKDESDDEPLGAENCYENACVMRADVCKFSVQELESMGDCTPPEGREIVGNEECYCQCDMTYCPEITSCIFECDLQYFKPLEW